MQTNQKLTINCIMLGTSTNDQQTVTYCTTGPVRCRHDQSSRVHSDHRPCDRHTPCTDLHSHVNRPTFTRHAPTYIHMSTDLHSHATHRPTFTCQPTYIHTSTDLHSQSSRLHSDHRPCDRHTPCTDLHSHALH